MSKPQLEFFKADETARLRGRVLMSRAEFSAAVRSGKLRAVEQHPIHGAGYPSTALNQLSAESQGRIVMSCKTPVDVAALTLARKSGRDTPTDQDTAAARLWVKSTPAQRVGLASGFKTLNGGPWGCRLASNGVASFYRLP